VGGSVTCALMWCHCIEFFLLQEFFMFLLDALRDIGAHPLSGAAQGFEGRDAPILGLVGQLLGPDLDLC